MQRYIQFGKTVLFVHFLFRHSHRWESKKNEWAKARNQVDKINNIVTTETAFANILCVCMHGQTFILGEWTTESDDNGGDNDDDDESNGNLTQTVEAAKTRKKRSRKSVADRAAATRESHLNCDQTNRQVTYIHNEWQKESTCALFPSEGQKMTPKCGWILFLVLFVPNYIETGEYWSAISSLFLYFFHF